MYIIVDFPFEQKGILKKGRAQFHVLTLFSSESLHIVAEIAAWTAFFSDVFYVL